MTALHSPEWEARALPSDPHVLRRAPCEMSRNALPQLAWAHLKAIATPTPAGVFPEHDRESHGKDTGSAHNLKAAG
jgi:hypothetical protein